MAKLKTFFSEGSYFSKYIFLAWSCLFFKNQKKEKQIAPLMSIKIFSNLNKIGNYFKQIAKFYSNRSSKPNPKNKNKKKVRINEPKY